MSSEARMYEFTVQGQYYGVHDATGSPTVKVYVAKFVLPSQEAALSVIVKNLLDPYLRKHYADYAKFRSHKITSMVVNGRLPDAKVLQMAFEDMDIRDLSDFCILKQIFIDPYKHKDLEKCREDIKAAYETRVSQQKADQKSGQAAAKVEVDSLLDLNKLPKSGDNPEINMNAQRIAAAVQKSGVDIRPTEAPSVDAPLPPVLEDDTPLPAADEADLLS